MLKKCTAVNGSRKNMINKRGGITRRNGNYTNSGEIPEVLNSVVGVAYVKRITLDGWCLAMVSAYRS